MNEDTKIKEKVWKIKGKVSYIDFFLYICNRNKKHT